MQNEDFAREKADELHVAGRLAEAIEVYSRLLDTHPRDAELLMARSAAYIETEEYEHGARDAIAAYELNESSAAAAFNAGLALDLGGRTDESIEWFERACAVDPEFGKAHAGLANALYDLERYDEASEHYEIASRLDVEFDEVDLYWARSLVRIGEYEAAATRFSAQYELDSSTEALAGAGQIRYLLGDSEGAKELLKTAVTRDPSDHDSLLYLAAIFRQEGHSAEEISSRLSSVLEEADTP